MDSQSLFILKKIQQYIESFATFLASLAFKKFDKKKYQFSFKEVWYSPHEVNREFNQLYSKIYSHTLISKRKLHFLYNISKQISKLKDSFMKIGTLRGGSAALLVSNLLNNELILWDRWSDKIASVKKKITILLKKNMQKKKIY